MSFDFPLPTISKHDGWEDAMKEFMELLPKLPHINNPRDYISEEEADKLLEVLTGFALAARVSIEMGKETGDEGMARVNEIMMVLWYWAFKEGVDNDKHRQDNTQG